MRRLTDEEVIQAYREDKKALTWDDQIRAIRLMREGRIKRALAKAND